MRGKGNSCNMFSNIFSDISMFCKDYDLNLYALLVVTKNMFCLCCNVATETSEDYCRITIYIPVLDSVFGQIDECLNNDVRL